MKKRGTLAFPFFVSDLSIEAAELARKNWNRTYDFKGPVEDPAACCRYF